MGFIESVFGGSDKVKFAQPSETEETKAAREKLSGFADTGFRPVPLRGVADLPEQTAERQLARTTATDLAKPREQFDFASSPEVQGIIARTVEQGNLIANRIGRAQQKSGAFQSTTGRDVLSRTVKEIEGNIAANLAQFAEAERGRDFADTQRRQNLVGILENLGLTDEERERGTEQAKLDALFQQKIGGLSQEQQLISLLQNIIQLDPSRQAVPFVKEAGPGLIEQISAIADLGKKFVPGGGGGGGDSTGGGGPSRASFGL